ncbi:MAG: hypothetical protein HQK62_01530 [Desulfamplus sp.]|nr:hypothetical protein [Desulfamplus sp.]
MLGREYPNKTKGSDSERSSRDIRQDIAKGEDEISQTVEQISERIIEKLDWRGYVRDYPYLAIGGAAGIGYLASGLFIKRATPMERIMGSIAEEVRDSLDGMLIRNSGPGLVRMTLLGIATRAATALINNIISTDTSVYHQGSQPQTLCSSDIIDS